MGSHNDDDLELLITAMHEAGHAVFNLAYRLPLYDSRIWLERRLFRKPVGVGETRHQKPDRTPPADPDAMLEAFMLLSARQQQHVLVSELAGAEAEAVAMHRLIGEPLRICRLRAAELSRDGERAATMLRSPAVNLTERTARSMTAAEVAARWPAIERVGQALHQRHRLTAREIRRLAA